MVARADGQPIRWPEPTHGPGRSLPWRTAAEIIDWSIPMCSIFASPDEAKTWAAANGVGVPNRPLKEATMRRIAAGVHRYVLDQPPYLVRLGTGLIAAWMAKHYGGVVGHRLDRPIGTVTAVDHHSPVAVDLAPEPTARASESAAFLVSFYGTGHAHSLRAPLPTLTTVDRFGFVRVDIDGTSHVVNDIRMRMLAPREQATAQGFGPDYILTGTKREQTGRIGNSVCPDAAEAVVRAQHLDEPSVWRMAA
jgi:DNA (cytosine-5)-methyltransferase 1